MSGEVAKVVGDEVTCTTGLKGKIVAIRKHTVVLEVSTTKGPRHVVKRHRQVIDGYYAPGWEKHRSYVGSRERDEDDGA